MQKKSQNEKKSYEISLSLFLLFLFFTIISKAQDVEHINLKKPVTFHGNLNFQLDYYSANGIPARQKEFSWIINGNPVLNVLGIDLPFTFLFSNFGNKYSQPFNQFGLSPRYKWITMHLGYRNLTYSNYTLAGHKMLGVGFDLNPKKFRIGFMYGQLRRSASIDSTMNTNPMYVRPTPTFKRVGIAGKIGYGSQKNYVDLVYFKGWDKPSSLNGKLKDSIQPAENTSFGLVSTLSLSKKITWTSDIGFSAYTLNRMDRKDSSDIDKAWPKDIMGPLVSDKLSTQYYFAGETKIGYQEKKWGAQLKLKRIDPGYQSMGAYFFQNDIKEYSLANNFKLDSNRLNINTNIGIQTDNLKKQKSSTSKRFIGSVNVNYVPSQKFGISFNYSNFGITNSPLQTSPGNEQYKQVNNSVMLMPYLLWTNEKTFKNLNCIATFQSLSTPQSYGNNTPDMNTFSFSTNYSQTWIKPGINANVAMNFINSKTTAGDVGSIGGSVGGSAPLMKKRLTLNTSFSYLQNKFKGNDNGNTIRFTLGFMVPVGTHHNFQLMCNYLDNTSKDVSLIQNFKETNIQFIYGLTF
ncbi:MAG: hypothetical protein JNK36_11250 [Bacteroidia bacterium]|nr:hypothetical protein [Bacteroidia bacterium]MBP7713860.1 hypothetical protein [Bacteroidia bacterium]MBP8668188.1 hypothetical protein [Bacteroidia bacterium]QQR96264.1 MAG: hypothetical protein IPJ93_06480 [Bacteroidota bacterium]HQZ76606.1 hypothetical protein [Bacteroidia bacterium]